MGSVIHIGDPGVPNRTYDIPIVSVDKYFLLENNFSDVLDAALARQNLGINALLGGTWGDITGNIATQSDLAAQFALKSNITNPTFLGSTTSPNIIFSSGASTIIEAKLSWNDTAGTLALGMKDGWRNTNLGADQHIRIINKSGYMLYSGQVVYLNGSNSGFPSVTLSKADAIATSNAQAIVVDNIADNEYGYVYTIGTISGLNTSSYNVSDTLYLSSTTAGSITNVAPLTPYYSIPIGVVLTKDASTGSILFVGNKPSSASNLTVDGAAPDATHNVLVWDNALGYWKADQNFANWNTAYTWGNHASAGYLTGAHSQAESTITFTNITTGDASLTNHGFLPRLGGGTSNYLRADGTWATPAGGSGMVYPGDGIALVTGGVWGTSITNNSANWNTAYGWGNHASAGYVDTAGAGANQRVAFFTDANTITGLSGFTWDGTTLNVPGNITANGEISAFIGAAPVDWWTSMPAATSTTRGGIILDAGLAVDKFFNGAGSWVTLSSGTTVHSSLSNLDYASAGHTGFLPATHLTDFTHANIANGQTAYGWGNHSGLYTPVAHATNTLNPHSVTKTQVSLGNVTNESKATMFTNPAFTGTATFGSSTITNAGDFELRGTGVGDSTAVRLFAATGNLYLQNGSGDNIIFRSKTGAETAKLTNAGIFGVGGLTGLTPTNWGYSASYKVLMLGGVSGSESTVSIGYNPSANANGSFSGDGREILFRRGAQFVTPNAANDSFYLTNLTMKDGRVGIGTAVPDHELDVRGTLVCSGDIIAYHT